MHKCSMHKVILKIKVVLSQTDSTSKFLTYRYERHVQEIHLNKFSDDGDPKCLKPKSVSGSCKWVSGKY